MLAFAWMVGFYTFALAIVTALVWTAYSEFPYLRSFPILFGILVPTLGAALALLWALVPRVDVFTPPGPVLNRADAPRLFGIIDEVAKATAQTVPRDVYLLNHVNAWVTHRGGVMGIGSHRVMGIGLPLLTQLSASELRAVIAHEFGHFVAGDVGVAPFVYKTRSAIARAVESTEDTWVGRLIQWYATGFLRLSQAVAREQEFAADRLSADIAGVDITRRALQHVATLERDYSAYLHLEVLPVVQMGYLPPLASGFALFVASTTASRTSEVPDFALGRSTGEFDSHPALGDRLDALTVLGRNASLPHAVDDSPVLPDADRHARDTLAFVISDDEVEALQAIDWDGVGRVVYPHIWARIISDFAVWFGDRTADGLPCTRAEYVELGHGVPSPQLGPLDEEELATRAVNLFAVGFGCALVRAGWSVSAIPGQPLSLVRGDEQLIPYMVVEQLADGAIDPQVWRARCAHMGIAGLLLAPLSVRHQLPNAGMREVSCNMPM